MSTLRVDTLQTTDSSFSVDVKDITGTLQLSADLANKSDPTKGSALIGYRGRTVTQRLDDEVNVLDFGADPTGVVDSLSAFNAARDKLQGNFELRGGKIKIPAGNYKLSNTWQFTSYVPRVVHNITIEGDGIQCTTLDFSTAPAGADGISFTGQGAQMRVGGMTIDRAKRRGLSIVTCNQWEVADMRIQNCVDSGFWTNDSWMGSIERVWCTTNGADGFHFNGKHTSINMYRCYASYNVGQGFLFNGVTYSSLNACGSDVNNKGYVLSNCRAITFLGCGTESNKTDGWYLFSSNASQPGIPVEYLYLSGIELIGCVAYFNSTLTPATYGNFLTAVANDGNPIQFSMRGCGSSKGNVSDFAVVLAGAGGPITYKDDDAKHDGAYSITGNVVANGYLESIIPSGSSLGLTTGVTRNVTSLILPAGDWDVDATALFTPTSTTSVTGYYCGISTASGVLPGEQDYMTGGVGYTRAATANTFNLRSPTVRVRSNGSTPVYMVVQGVFSASTLVACGKLTARKI